MTNTYPVQEIAQIEQLGNVVPVGYRYYPKLVTPRADLHLPTVYLKWYDIYPADAEITPEQLAESRSFLTAEAQKLKLQDELGFVLLHRAGTALLLLLTTWRNTNEMWESVYVKEIANAEEYRPLLFEGSHRGTYCVWELAPIWHERHAWVRFLSSPRDAAAKLAYIHDRFSGWT